MPLVSPVIWQLESGGVTVQLAPPGAAVTMYEVGTPPDPLTTVIVTEASPPCAVGVPGAPGAISENTKLTSLVSEK